LLCVVVATGIALYLPYLGVGRGAFGFLRGYAIEEGLRNGHGVVLLDNLSRFGSLPHWAATAYFVFVLVVLAAFQPASPSAALWPAPDHSTLRARPGAQQSSAPSCWSRSRRITAVFQLAGAAGLRGAARQRAVAAGRRAAVGA
jgi:hypothetical protein